MTEEQLATIELLTLLGFKIPFAYTSRTDEPVVICTRKENSTISIARVTSNGHINNQPAQLFLNAHRNPQTQ